MFKTKNNLFMALICIGALCVGQIYAAIKPNPIISRGTGADVKVSSGTAKAINDDKWAANEKTPWAVTNDSWIAIKDVAGTYSKVFISWDSPDTSWSGVIGVNPDSCKKVTAQYPTDYTIQTSSTSNTGADGTWKTVDSITGNNVCARGHIVDFIGATWIKMNIIKGTGKIDEVEVFDASNGLQDSWFFLGTKITAMMMKRTLASGYPTDSLVPFADQINIHNKSNNPVVIRGGINCGVQSSDVVRDISKYLQVVGNVSFWAIELGTWDAWGGKKENLAKFKSNLQIIIDSCKAHKIVPIIARVMPTDSASSTRKNFWQVPRDFMKVVDTLANSNNIPAGPDFFAYCYGPPRKPGDPQGYNDIDGAANGILPNQFGNYEFQRCWALRMDTAVYKGNVMANPIRTSLPIKEKISVISKNGTLALNSGNPGTIAVYTINGEMVDKIAVIKAGAFKTKKNAPGLYLVKFTSEKGVMETMPVLNR
jgi:hypothetical protein